MARIAVTIISIALATMANTAFAEIDVDALQKENERLKKSLTMVTRGRAYLKGELTKLRKTSAGRIQAGKFLKNQLDDATAANTRLEKISAGRMQAAKSVQNKAASDIAALDAQIAKQEKALAGGAKVRKSLYKQIKDLKAQNASLTEQLDGTKADHKYMSDRLRRAIAYSSANRGKLEKAEEDRKYLSGRLRRAIAYSSSSRGALEKQVATAVTGRDHLRNKLLSTLNEKKNWASKVGGSMQDNVGGVQGTEVTIDGDNNVKVQVGNNGLFRTGGTRLSADGTALLSLIAQQLTQQDANITVIGHTDNIPVGEGNAFANNEALSFARAVSTLQFLRSQGVATERLSAAGYGADNPIAGNDTPEGRQQNRRVEIILKAP